MPWWASPAGINFGFLVPILLIIAHVGTTSYSGLTIRGIRYLTADYILLGCGVLLVTGLSGWIGSFVRFDPARGAPARPMDWDRAAAVVGAVTLMAYAVWFRDFLLNPLLLIDTLLGKYRPDRTNIQLTTGITSLANLAPAFFSIYAYKVIAVRARVSRSLNVMCGALIAFTLFRVYAWSERLAMIEASVPFGLAAFSALAGGRSKTSQVVSRLGPIIAIPALILYFAVFEYVRSWQYSEYNTQYGFWEFATGRLASYYYTSLNNGAGVLATANWPTYKFEYVLSWLHKAPLIGPMFSHAVDLQSLQLDDFLAKFGDPEFNNPSGIYGVIFDLGLPGGAVYFCVIGFIGGVTYGAYRSGALAGVLFYPLFFITFLEVFRMPYLGMSRAFTWALGIGLALLVNAFQAPRAMRAPTGPAIRQRVSPS